MTGMLKFRVWTASQTRFTDISVSPITERVLGNTEYDEMGNPLKTAKDIENKVFNLARDSLCEPPGKVEFLSGPEKYKNVMNGEIG